MGCDSASHLAARDCGVADLDSARKAWCRAWAPWPGELYLRCRGLFCGPIKKPPTLRCGGFCRRLACASDVRQKVVGGRSDIVSFRPTLV